MVITQVLVAAACVTVGVHGLRHAPGAFPSALAVFGSAAAALSLPLGRRWRSLGWIALAAALALVAASFALLHRAG